jgi:hypothetical protein
MRHRLLQVNKVGKLYSRKFLWIFFKNVTFSHCTVVMHNRENENIGYREANIGYSIV